MLWKVLKEAYRRRQSKRIKLPCPTWAMERPRPPKPPPWQQMWVQLDRTKEVVMLVSVCSVYIYIYCTHEVTNRPQIRTYLVFQTCILASSATTLCEALQFHQVADHMTSLWPWRSGIVTNAVSIWKSFQGSKNDSEISKAARISIYGISRVNLVKCICIPLDFLFDHKDPHKFGTFVPSVCSFFVPAGTGVNRKRGAHRSPAM